MDGRPGTQPAAPAPDPSAPWHSRARTTWTQVKAKGAVEVTEVGKTISVDEYALIEDETPPVAAED